MDVLDLTIQQLHEGFKKKDFSSTEVTKAYLEHIKKTDKKIDAFLSVTEDLALAQAKAADKEMQHNKDFGMLCGVPYSVKDAILVEGERCTAGSNMLKDYVAPYDATVIKKLKQEYAVIVGKTNLDEYAMGVSTENSAFKITKNPHDTSRVAGGSSGGAAASVAAKEACYALGSDTGGSIRLPASFCGVVGLNPTYGTVSRYGLIALASSLDQIGPVAKTVSDAKAIFAAISGKDSRDATSADYRFTDSPVSLKGLNIGVPKEYFEEGIDQQVQALIQQAIMIAEKKGANIMPISLPHTKYAMAAYYIIVPSEASSNLARYDGIRYGLSSQSAKDLLGEYVESRGQGFGPEPKRRILIGTHALSSGYYDEYYHKAQEIRTFVKRDFTEAFTQVDVIFSPVSPVPAFKIGEKASDPLSMYLMDIYTGPVKLAGIPALSLPVGTVGGLPVGLQIIGNYFQENKLFGIAKALEELLA